jgi:hypothetical protein
LIAHAGNSFDAIKYISSMLRNGGKHSPSKMYTHTTIIILFMQRRGKDTFVKKRNCQKIVFSMWFVQRCVSRTVRSNELTVRRIERATRDGSRMIEKIWQERNCAVKRRLYVCNNDSETVIIPLPGYDE